MPTMGKILTAGVGQRTDNHVPMIMDSDHPETNVNSKKPAKAYDSQWVRSCLPKMEYSMFMHLECVTIIMHVYTQCTLICPL